MATGPSSSATPYLIAAEPNVRFTSILTVGDSVNLKPDGVTPYRMVGIPDGLGSFDNGNGTFTILMNHELGNTSGVVRAHGALGSFVSKWIVNKADLSVVSGSDLIQSQQLWNTTTSSYVSGVSAIARLCSADLADVSAFYNAATGLGTQDRIFLSGEETGAEGRLFGHVVTGSNAGVSFQLAALGSTSYENAVANTATGDKTVVLTTDDSTPGQVYLYIGDKQATGTAVEKAGLTNGQLYGIVAQGIGNNATSEAALNGATPFSGTFSLASLGDVRNKTGAQLETASDSAGVSEFWRPEDIAWDPTNPNVAYFVTTANVTSPSRLYRLTFDDITNPNAGGHFDVLLDGTEGQKMMDNISVNLDGTLTIVEDVGGNPRLGKVWHYDPASDTLTQLAEHDAARFLAPTAPFSQDEEASGVIDVTAILGDSDTQAFLIDVQAHYPISGELAEGGQLLAMYIDEVKDGGNGDDRVAGDAGDNTLNGNRGNDEVLGGSGNDILLGARGNDTLNGGRGNDVLQGGLDNDVFDFSVITNGDVDYITDFSTVSDTLLLGAGITVTAVSIQRTVATEANGFDLQNSSRAFDLMLTLSNGSATQTLHILDAYAFSTNNFWENALGVDLTYPQPLPIGETSVMIA
jgi:hypothetical protein